MTENRTSGPAWLVPAVNAMPSVHGVETAQELVAAGITGLRMFHLNESPYPPSPRAVEAAAAELGALNRYPSAWGKPLAEALAVHTGVAAERIVIARGSAELIEVATAITTLPGDDVVGPGPSFPGQMIATKVRSANFVRVPLTAAGASDADALLSALTNRTKLLWCCTPNPPAGGMMSAEALERLAASTPENVLLAVDEAYSEFGRAAGGPDALPILERRRGPWVILRTFSKAYGLSGLRVGYALCSTAEVASAFRKAMGFFHVTTPSLAAAKAALADQGHLQKTLKAVAGERDRLTEGLKRLGLSPIPSFANFVSVKMPFPAEEAAAELEKRGILVRGWRDPKHLMEIRITVGLPDDTDAVLLALAEILKAKTPG